MGRISTQTITGVLVADQRKDQVLLLQDLDGDGTAQGAGETTVFFDADNASGFESPTPTPMAMHRTQAKPPFGSRQTMQVACQRSHPTALPKAQMARSTSRMREPPRRHKMRFTGQWT